MNNKVMPTTYFILFLILSIVLNLVLPIVKFSYFPSNLAGILFIIFGIMLNIRTDAMFKSSGTTVKLYEVPTAFQVTGPFRVSRHPMYLGMMFILLGAAIVMMSLVTFLFPILFIVCMEIIFIPAEERSLENQFGKDYLIYRKKVRR